MNRYTQCGLCHGYGVIRDYEDEWPCPLCNAETEEDAEKELVDKSPQL